MSRRRFSNRKGTFVALTAASALFAFAPAAFAKTYTPNKTGDSAPNGCSRSNCTLREAVIAANNRSGSDKIVLQAGKTYKLSIPNAGPMQEDLSATGDLDILGSLQIKSSSKKFATVTAQGIDRVFETSTIASVSASFKYLRIKGGNASRPGEDGGGVLGHAGTVKITNSRLSGNSANDRGGAVANNDNVNPNTTKISKSTIDNNHAGGFGGGIDSRGIAGPASLTLSNSTVNANTAADNGGGVEVEDGALASVTNSTITENKAEDNGGGLRIADAGTFVTLSSVTVARNTANSDGTGNNDGGGLSQLPTATAIVRNSIVALNTVIPGGSGPDCDGAFSSQGVNLFTFIDANCTGFLFPPNLITTNPKLGSLKKNGGPTKTLALKSGSPAINNAGSGSPKKDQRGEKRKNPDIGAYERT